MKIPSEDYLNHAPNIASSVPNSHNHDGCTGGVDTKHRLYVWRKESGAVSAYCHNCGLHGYTPSQDSTRNVYSLRQATRNVNVPKSMSVQLPRDMSTDWRTWPSKAKVWLFKGLLGEQHASKYNMGYSPFLDRVILPVYDKSNGKILGWQGRRLSDDGTPKYITTKMEGHDLYFSCEFTGVSSIFPDDTICIVEDTLSAIRVSEHMNALAFLGVRISRQLINYLTKHYSNVILYLDNDNYIVKKKQEQFKNTLQLYMNKVIVIKETKDPKELTSKELLTVLRRSL